MIVRTRILIHSLFMKCSAKYAQEALLSLVTKIYVSTKSCSNSIMVSSHSHLITFSSFRSLDPIFCSKSPSNNKLIWSGLNRMLCVVHCIQYVHVYILLTLGSHAHGCKIVHTGHRHRNPCSVHWRTFDNHGMTVASFQL